MALLYVYIPEHRRWQRTPDHSEFAIINPMGKTNFNVNFTSSPLSSSSAPTLEFGDESKSGSKLLEAESTAAPTYISDIG